MYTRGVALWHDTKPLLKACSHGKDLLLEEWNQPAGYRSVWYYGVIEGIQLFRHTSCFTASLRISSKVFIASWPLMGSRSKYPMWLSVASIILIVSSGSKFLNGTNVQGTWGNIRTTYQLELSCVCRVHWCSSRWYLTCEQWLCLSVLSLDFGTI